MYSHVDLYEVGPSKLKNLVFLASDQRLEPLRWWTRAALPGFDPGDVISDRLNSLDRLQIAQGEAFREWYLRVLGPEALLP